MANTRKTWTSIVIAAAIVITVLVGALVGGGALFIHRHLTARFVPSDTASAELAGVRARFAGQAPMIELRADEVQGADDEDYSRFRAVVHRGRVAPGEIHALHVLAYDSRRGKLVRADIPRWLLQLGSANGRIRIADLDILQGDRERVTLADFDERGPGLVINVRRMGTTDLVVWTD